MQSKSSSDINQEQIEQLEYAQKRINQKKNLYYNFVLFLFASVICLTPDHIFSIFDNVYFLNYSWSFWIIFIWFFALLFHVFNVYVTNKFINNSWVKKQKAKLINLQKMKIENCYQMRGLCVDDSFQNRGIGKKLVKKVEEKLKKLKIDNVWMNARESAIQFYLNLNYTNTNIKYSIGQIGLHFLMYKKL